MVMTPPEKLSTKRTLLRPVEPADAEAIFAYSSSPIAMRYMHWPLQTSLEQVKLAKQSRERWENGSSYPWAIIHRTAGEFIGVIELRLTPPRANLGYILIERFWRQGFATEVTRAVVSWAMEQDEISRVDATCHPDNAASIKVLTNAGLKLEARLESGEERPQLGLTTSPELLFAITKAAMEKREN